MDALLKKTAFIILAAGLGSRMNSRRAKAMHKIAGKPMLEHLVEMLERSFQSSSANTFVVVHAFKDQITEHFGDRITPVFQDAPQGTAHAVGAVLPHLKGFDQAVILYGDVPFVAPETIRALLRKQAYCKSMTILTAILDDPTGYGRIIRSKEDIITAIVEDRDASPVVRNIKEINTGILTVNVSLLEQFIPLVSNENRQKEYYLTTLVELISSEQQLILNVLAQDQHEVMGVNDMKQLFELERHYMNGLRAEMLQNGLRLLDPETLYLYGKLTYGKDCQISPNVLISGEVILGDRVEIGANCVLRDVNLGDDVVVLPFSHLEGARVSPQASIGPYARIRQGTVIKTRAKIGNFVEIKAAEIGEHTRVNHLTYLGDATIGDEVNIGAGTITCNYDGKRKHPTTIGNHAFIGSNSTLIAPLELSENVYVGAGSVVTEDLKEPGLVLGRARQVNKKGWKPKG